MLVAAIGRWRAPAATWFAVALALACLLPLSAHWRVNDQREFHLLGYYVRDVLQHVAPNAVLFSGNWDTVSSPALYYQLVQSFRPDVVVIDMGQLANPALDRRLAVAAPGLAAACAAEIAAVDEIARLSAAGRSYDVAAGRRRFRRLQEQLIAGAVERGPTYATRELFERRPFRRYHLVPEGLVGRLARADHYQPFAWPELAGPALAPSDLRDARERGLYAEYPAMLRGRARYLQRHGQVTEAIRYLDRAEELEGRTPLP
jgi:hypothetical protein